MNGSHYIELSGEWPPARREDHFLFTMLLRERGVRLRPGHPLRSTGHPHLLTIAQPLLEAFLTCAVEDGYLLRGDVARSVAAVEPWPRWALTPAQATGLIRQLVNCGHLESMYPISIWIVPATNSQGESLIDLFRALPHDEQVFNGILDSGVVRLSLFDAFCDILGVVADGPRVLAWLNSTVTLPLAPLIDVVLTPGDLAD